MDDNSPMPYGIHAGKPMGEIPAEYLFWLYDHNRCSREVRGYIENNIDALRSEMAQKRGRDTRLKCYDCQHLREVMNGWWKALKCERTGEYVEWNTPACEDFE